MLPGHGGVQERLAAPFGTKRQPQQGDWFSLTLTNIAADLYGLKLSQSITIAAAEGAPWG